MKFTRPTLLLFIAFAIYWSFESLTPRESGMLAVDPSHFDLDRAKSHVEQISRKPHAVGFPAHAEVREYLIGELEKMGLSVQLQSGYTSGDWANVSQAVNIYARIEGTGEGGKDLLLLSHYDSSPHSSYGASDAGSGVATILEGVRSYLNEGVQPINDIIILFTDAEELGLNGADLFANQHPWTDHIGLILNFEARGSGGPSFMLLETNRGNQRMIEEFKKAGVRFPVANSLAYSIYKLLPNDTDLTVFREDRDIEGFNFAFVDDHYHYHTSLDTHENLDRRTLAHQGSYLAPLLRHFAQADLTDMKSLNDQAYYNMPYYGLVSYSYDLIWPMFFLALFLFISLMIVGIVRKKFNYKEVIKGFLPLFGTLLINGALGVFAWGALNSLYPGYEDMLHGFTYNGHTYIYAFIAFSLATCFLVYNRFYSLKSANLLIAPILLWLVLVGMLSYKLPGANYFVIPLFALLAGFLMAIWDRDEKGSSLPYKFVLTLPAIFILAPSIYMFPVALGLKMLATTTLLLSLVFFATLPFWHSLRMMTRLGALSLLMGFLFLFKAHLQSGFNDRRPKPTSLVYLVDMDDQTAQWATYDKVLDDWNSLYFPEGEEKSETSESDVLSSKYQTRFRRTAPAPVKEISGPEVEILKDTLIDGLRQISLNIQSFRTINRIDVYASGNEIIDAQVNGTELDSDFLKSRRGKEGNAKLFTHYVSNNASSEVTLVVSDNGQTVDLDIYEASNDLLTHPRFSVAGRPGRAIPMPFVLNDAIIVHRSFRIE